MSPFLQVFFTLLFSSATFLGYAENNEQEELILSTPEQVATLTADSSHLMEGLVSPLSGQVSLRQRDLVVKGAQELTLSRVYVPLIIPYFFTKDRNESHEKWFLYEYLVKNYKGWQFFPHRSLKYGPKSKVYLTCPYGTTLEFQAFFSGTSLASPHFAISNTAGDEPGGKYDPRNTRIIHENHAIIVHAPDGTVRFYKKLPASPLRLYHTALLEKEILPNGKVLKYKYTDRGDLCYVESLDPKERYVYASITIKGSPRGKSCQFISSSGQVADYEYEVRPFHVEIKGKNPRFKHKKVLDGPGPPLLTAVSSPFYREEAISYNDCFLLSNYSHGKIFSCTHANFGKQNKVQRLSLPVGAHGEMVPVYEMHYDMPIPGEKPGWTSVKTSDGIKVVYRYSKECLLEAIQYFKEETLSKEKVYKWTDDHWLKSLEIRDGEGALISKKTYAYDTFGNPICEILTGDLSGDGMQKDYTIRRKFSQDGRHLLLEEKYENGKIVQFSYLESTNLVTAKITKNFEKTVIREFNIYDDCHNLIKTICDDGLGSGPEDLEGVSQRTETHIALRKEPPFLHMPEWIEKKYIEGDVEKLLMKKHLVYDTCGNVAFEELYDANSQFAFTISKEFNERGDLLSETNSLGQKATYAYDTKGLRTGETNFSGRVLKKSRFDSQGRLSEESEEGSGICHRTYFEYDVYDRLIKITDPFGQQTSYSYDPLVDKVVETRFADGTRTSSAYDSLGCPLSYTDANGNRTSYRYNAYGSPSEITYANGEKELFRYTKEGLLNSHKTRDGLTIEFMRDILGRVISKTYITAYGTIAEESFIYNSFNLLKETDKEGHTITYTYDGAGRKIKEDVSGHITEYSYDALGRVATIRKHNGDNTLYIENKRDLEGRILEETKKDSLGNILYSIAYTYDEDGRKATTTRTINGETATTQKTYDPFGRLIAQQDPYGHLWTWTYDENSINPFGQRVLQIKNSDPQNITHTETQDIFQRPVMKEAIDQEGKVLSKQELSYDPHGNLIEQKDHVYRNGVLQKIHSLEKSYTSTHQLESATQGGLKTSLTYTPSGNIASKTLPDGRTLFYGYDLLGRLSALSSSDRTISQRFKYNKLGQLQEASDKDVSIERTLDSFGNVTKELFSTGLTLTKEYDDFNRLTKLKIPSIGEVTYSYDPLFLRQVTRVSVTGDELYTHRYDSYDLDGNLVKEELLRDLGAVLHKTDFKGQKTSISSPYLSQTLSYNTLGNLVESSKDQTLDCYVYDGLSQLIKENEKVYECDSLYNREAVNDANQLIKQSYDLNGNQTIKDEYCLSYDLLGQLIEAKSPFKKILFSYDPLGRRLSKAVYTATHSEWEEQSKESYLYHGNHEIGAFISQKPKNFRVLGLGETIAVELEGRVFAPIKDVQDNIVKLIDAESKKVRESCAFTAFGEDLAQEEFLNPWRFASKRFDQELRLVYFGKRYYDPEYGRWLTPDPLGFIDSTNLYQYVFNNPFRYRDLDGQFAFAIPFVVTVFTVTFDFAVSWVTTQAVVSAAVVAAVSYTVYKMDNLGKDYTQSHSEGAMYQESATEVKESKKGKKNTGTYAPDRPLPLNEHGVPIPDTDAAHTQLGTRSSKTKPGDKYPQAREFDKDGNPVRDIDFTDHRRPQEHTNPHQHVWEENSTGGCRSRGDPEPLQVWR